MAKVIYFDAEPTKKGVIRFVEDYRRGGSLRKEKIQYGIAGGYLPAVDVVKGIYDRIVRDYPGAIIWDGMVVDTERKLDTKRFWLIGKDTGKGFDVYYSHVVAGHIEWTSDVANAEIQFDEQAAVSTVTELRRTGEKAVVIPVYMNFDNPLLGRNFIILCKSKKSGVTKYFARHEEGNRIRLVKFSDSAARFNYAEAMETFESLKRTNKAFIYTMCPAFKGRVHFTDIDKMLESGKVARAVAVSDKLKWMNR